MVFCCLNQPITKPVYVSTGRPILFEIVSGPWFSVAFYKVFCFVAIQFSSNMTKTPVALRLVGHLISILYGIYFLFVIIGVHIYLQCDSRNTHDFAFHIPLNGGGKNFVKVWDATAYNT